MLERQKKFTITYRKMVMSCLFFQLTKEEKNQNGDQNIEIVDELIFYAFEKVRLEEFAPCPV